jgi:hypothetical protein
LVSIFLGLRILDLVDTYGCVLIAQDRWQTLDPLFYNYNWWEGFSHQHGPHRMGLIYFIFKANAYFSHWNTRADLFLQAIVYVLSTAMALKLKVKLFGKLSFGDVIIPLIFLTPHAANTMFNNPFVHGLVPLFAISLCFIYFIRSENIKLIALCTFSFLAAFTGFALVLIPIIVFVEILRIIKDVSLRSVKYTLPSIIGISSFAYIVLTNIPKPSSEVFAFSLKTGIKYCLALAGSFFVVTPKNTTLIAIAVALFILFILLLFLLFKTNTSVSNPVNRSIIILLGSVLVFWAINAYGRAHLSVGNAMASRYIPIGMLFALSVYFLILKLERRYVQWVFTAIFFVLVLRIQFYTEYRYDFIAERSAYFKTVSNCLRQENNFEKCKGVNSEYILHPKPKRIDLQSKLDYLEENKLNIFR